MTEIRAVLVDMDGTLRDTQTLYHAALHHTLGVYGVTGVTHEELVPHLGHHRQVYTHFLSGVELDTVEATHNEWLRDRLPIAPLLPGARAVLRALRGMGKQLAAVTSAQHESTVRYIETQKLNGQFTAVSGLRNGFEPKPKPDLLSDALSQLGAEPASAIMVGDTWVDVAAARALDMPCIGVCHEGGYGTREELDDAGAIAIAGSLAEVPQLIAKL